MKIALVTYEYPPDTGIGGIGTYFYQVSMLFKSRGHYIEVFSASFERHSSGDEGNGFLVHRIQCEDKHAFKKEIVTVFESRHNAINFNLFESPEYMADGLFIKKRFPDLPLVVKLHTPDFLVKDLNRLNPEVPSKWLRLRFEIGSYRRFKRPRPYWWTYDYKNDPEYQLIQLADLIATPSYSLGSIVAKKWKLATKSIVTIPYTFTPSTEMLEIPIETETNIISYIGRLEVRKGIEIFLKVIPAVVKVMPKVRFRFIGRDLMSSPVEGMTMKEFVKSKLSAYEDNIEFINHCSPLELMSYLSETDVCVFPSIWENFPNVCLEAMSAGRAIVASNKGGMKDMLSKPKAGILVNPKSASSISNWLIKLSRNKSLRYSLGNMARHAVQHKYNSNTIGEMTEDYFKKIVKT